MREIFERFDSSGDGRLDHLELKLAIRLTAGDEVPLADCERIVRALDTDGNGALDFHEFKQALAECSGVSLGRLVERVSRSLYRGASTGMTARLESFHRRIVCVVSIAFHTISGPWRVRFGTNKPYLNLVPIP